MTEAPGDTDFDRRPGAASDRDERSVGRVLRCYRTADPAWARAQRRRRPLHGRACHVVVSESFAQQVLAGDDALGRTVRSQTGAALEVVGVAQDASVRRRTPGSATLVSALESRERAVPAGGALHGGWRRHQRDGGRRAAPKVSRHERRHPRGAVVRQRVAQRSRPTGDPDRHARRIRGCTRG